jgi:hypothetical protein
MTDHFEGSDSDQVLVTPSRSMQSLPYNSITWRDFEFFVAELIGRLPEFESVQNYGALPYNQRGIDILANGTGFGWAFQCKRVQSFDVSNFQNAVKKAADFTADRFVLALSCRAKPKLIDAARSAKWEIWDADELDRRVRTLDDAFTLVDGYFGRVVAKAFLGRRKPGIFLSPQEYFAPYLRPGRADDLGLAFIDRVEQLQALHSFLGDAGKRIMIISGPSGVGKTKLIYELSKSIPDAESSMRFAREAADIEDDAFDELPASTTVLLIDDVRRIRQIENVASAIVRSSEKLLLVARSGDEADLAYRLQEVGFDSNAISKLMVKSLSQNAAAELVKATLADAGPRLHAIYRLSSGIPLVIQVITYLINEGQRDLLEALSTKDYPVAILFARYADVLAGKVSEAQDCRKADILDALRLLAAVGPRDIRTSDFKEAALRFLNWDSTRLAVTINALEVSGLLLRSGSKSRIIPELLGLYILREICGVGTVQSDFAQRIVRDFGYDRQVLLNLATVDRMDEAASAALRPVWRYLEKQVRVSSAFERLVILDELDDLGYVLPGLMLGVVEFIIRNPAQPNATQPLQELHQFDQADVLRKVPRILQSIARSSIELLPQCVHLLWELGRDEERHFGYDSAFEILVGLVTYERYKPITYVVTVLSEIEKINARLDEQQHRHLPVEIAAPALAKSYDSMESRGASVTFQRMAVNLTNSAPARAISLNIMATALNSGSPRSASKAAEYLAGALLGSSAQSSEEEDDLCDRERDRILDLFLAVRNDPARGLIKARIAALLSWHAKVNSSAHVRKRASSIIAGLEGTSEFDWYAALIPDIARHMPTVEVGADFQQLQNAIDGLLDRVINRILADRWAPRHFAQTVIDTLREATAASLHGAAGWLFVTLSNRDLDYAKHVVDVIISDFGGELGDSISPVLYAAWSTDEEWADRTIAAAFASNEQKLFMGVAHAVWMHRAATAGNAERDADRRAAIIAQLIQVGNKDVKEVTLRAVGTLLSINRTKAIELILSLDLGADASTADELFANLRLVEPHELGEHGLRRMLTYIATVEELDYWAMEFLRKLAKDRADEVLDLLMRRIERSAELPSRFGGFKPLPYGHVIVPHEVQFFDELSCSPNAIGRALDHGFALNDRGRYWFAELISNLARKPEPLFTAFETWIAEGQSERLQFIAQAMHRIPFDVIFAKASFVVALVDATAALGEEAARRVSSALFSAATTGLRAGLPFEPMPQDVAMIDRARAIRSTLVQGSPAYSLFDDIVRYGEESVTKKLEADVDTFGEPDS